MSQYFLTLYPTELDRVLRAPGGPVGRYTNYVARSIAAEAQANANLRIKRRTGRYAAGFKVQVEREPVNGFQFTVTNSTTGLDPRRRRSYAGVLEFGSAPHLIRPRPTNRAGGYLVFTVDGHKIVTKVVRHPGTKPYNILRDAQTTVRRRMGY